MLSPVRALLGGAVRLAHSRLAIFGVELREEATRVRSTLVGAFAAIILGGLGLAFAGAALVIAADESHRAAVAAGAGIVFLATSLYAAWWVRHALAAKPSVFGSSLAELERDREALVGESQAARASVAEGGEELLRLASIGVMAYTIARRLQRD